MPDSEPTSLQKLIAEFLGTFALVFTVVGSAVSNGPPVSSGLGLVGAAVGVGLVLAVAVATCGGISGAHFNPSVTLSLLAVGRVPVRLVVPYIATQVAAATLAALACQSMYPPEAIEATRLALCGPASWLTSPVTTVLFCEAVLTFLLMFGVYGTIIDPRGAPFAVGGGIGVGSIVAANILAAGAVSGAAMNPARALGPALVQMNFDYHWCYWIAPCGGALLATLIYEHLILAKTDRTDAKQHEKR